MSMMDNLKDKMSGMSDEAKGRYEELKKQEETGTLDDPAKLELQQLRAHFEK